MYQFLLDASYPLLVFLVLVTICLAGIINTVINSITVVRKARWESLREIRSDVTQQVADNITKADKWEAREDGL